MSTKLTKQLTYDASAEAVTAMLDDRAFREEVLERQHVARGSVDIQGDEVTIEQVRPADGLPSFVQKFVGDEIVIVQTGDLDLPDVRRRDARHPRQARRGRRHADPHRGPAARRPRSIDLDLSVRIPLVGGKIESLVAGLFRKALDREHEVGVEWLAR